MTLVNGVAAGTLSALDRGVLLGDGLFETLQMRNGRPQLWRYHRERLARGLQCLGFPGLEEAAVLEELARATNGNTCMARLTITRGVGPRGYAPPSVPAITRIVSAGPARMFPAPLEAQPLMMGWAEVSIGVNPALAGLKHTSRLEHVLARSGWHAEWDEAVLRDALGRVISASQGNLWLREGRTLLTPPVDAAGIAGTRRAWILEHARQFGLRVHEAYPEPARVRSADALYVSNARLGIAPARLIDADIPAGTWQDDPLYPMGIALHEAD
ncbi:aminodeoxychorismate lyase [Thioalkalivibrio sp. ALJT]|uniref:aminodeoxychorismate lyase n=1 Tax=Thioalkalivibrio sp. ALJT TaxID=1158146 RepID=UPI00037AE0A1|nr:aminodeoxychorismate lyase [Thioalkalivibrio sp. ALJT]